MMTDQEVWEIALAEVDLQMRCNKCHYQLDSASYENLRFKCPNCDEGGMYVTHQGQQSMMAAFAKVKERSNAHHESHVK